MAFNRLSENETHVPDIFVVMKSLFAVIFTCVVISSSFGQQKINTYGDYKSEHWVMRKYENDPLNTRHYTFENGLTLITSENPRSPRVYTMIAIKTGSKNDPADHTGLAHYLEHLLFKGTEKYGTSDYQTEKLYLEQIDSLYEVYNHQTTDSLRKIIYHYIDSISYIASKYAIANEYDKMCQAIGARGTNAFTSNEMTVYINDVPSNSIEKWIKLEGERFHNPVFRLFHTELEAVYEEKNISIDRDMSQVWEQMNAEMFKKHNYGLQTTIGTIEHLKNPSIKAIREYYNTYYVPNNMSVIVSGDINSDSVAQWVYENFSHLKPKDVPKYSFDFEAPRNVERKIDIYGPNQEMIMVGYRIDGMASKQVQVAKMIELILNNAKAGLMDLNLVKAQKVQGAAAFISEMKDYSQFMLYGTPKSEQTLDSVKTLLLNQIEKLKNGEFDESLIKAIVLNKEIEQIEEWKKNSNRCSFIMESFVNEIPYHKAVNSFIEIGEVTKEDIIRVSNEIFGNDRIAVYKHKGETPEREKVVKPTINPVELNREKSSDFINNWVSIPVEKISPVYFDPNSVTQDKFKGTRFLYVKNEDNRLFNLQFQIAYGSLHDNKLSLLSDLMQLLGTNEMTNAEISNKLYALGCDFRFGVGEERSTLSISGPKENFKAATEIITQWFNNPKWNQEVLEAVKQAELMSRQNYLTNPQYLGYALSEWALYGKNNHLTRGLTNSKLKSVDLDDLKALHENLMKAKTFITYFGPDSIENIQTFMKGLNWTSRKKEYKLKHPLVLEPKTYKNPKVFFVNFPMVQANVYWLSSEKQSYDLTFNATVKSFNQYFGGDMSSVVFQTIRESKALAYSTNAYYSTPSIPQEKFYTFKAFVGTQSDKFHEAISGMDSLFQSIPDEPKIFEMSKQSLLTSIESNRSIPENAISTFLTYERFAILDQKPVKVQYDVIKQTSMYDILEFHKKFIKSTQKSMAVVGSLERISKEDLERYGDLEILKPEELFGF